MAKQPMQHFIVSQPQPGDTRERNAYGMLKGFGKAYAEYHKAEEIARAAWQDEGNRSMRAGGRKVWSEEDYNAACRECNRFMDIFRQKREARHE